MSTVVSPSNRTPRIPHLLLRCNHLCYSVIHSVHRSSYAAPCCYLPCISYQMVVFHFWVLASPNRPYSILHREFSKQTKKDTQTLHKVTMRVQSQRSQCTLDSNVFDASLYAPSLILAVGDAQQILIRCECHPERANAHDPIWKERELTCQSRGEWTEQWKRSEARRNRKWGMSRESEWEMNNGEDCLENGDYYNVV